jgi:ParB family chromosome partitioning protein
MKFPAFEPINLKNSFGLTDIQLELISPDPNQPRKFFSDKALTELSESIKKYGVIQPIIVREISKEKYLIIAGERRWRASKLAGVKSISAIVKTDKHEDNAAISLIENIQRESLNPVELAESYQKLCDEHRLSHDDLSKMIGKSRTAITNTIRLLNLSDEIKKQLAEGKIEAGHARSLLSLCPVDQEKFANKIISDKLSVREIEQEIRRFSKNNNPEFTGENLFFRETQNLEFELSNIFKSSATVKINSDGSGNFSVKFSSIAQIKSILNEMKEHEKA